MTDSPATEALFNMNIYGLGLRSAQERGPEPAGVPAYPPGLE